MSTPGRPKGEYRSAQHEGTRATSLATAVRAVHALVHVPPAGCWNSFQNAVLLPAQAWLGRPLGDTPKADALVLRYLASFGPATVADIATWSGLAAVADTVERLGPRLRRYRDDDGRVLLDLKRATLPDPDTPAPIRLIGEFDNLVLSHADRRRLLAEEHRTRVITLNGQVRACVLLDGRVQGCWKIVRDKKRVDLVVEPFRPLSTAERSDITAEAQRALGFATMHAQPGGITTQVRFDKPA